MTHTKWIAIAVSILAILAIALVIEYIQPGPSPSPVAPAGGCTDWRWIGIKKSPPADLEPANAKKIASCPELNLDGWKGERLFPGSDPRLPKLDDFCIYQKEEGVVTDGELSAIEALRKNDFEQLERDCLVVVPAGPDENRTRHLKDHFLANVGALPPSATTTPAVRLALLDTSPTSPPSSKATIKVPPQDHPPKAGSRHGYTLANLAADMLCAGGASSACAVQVTSRLALPVKKFDATQLQTGDRAGAGESGYVGTLGDLTVAIRDELGEWDPGSGVERLVINLALGWDPAHFGGPENDVQRMYPAVRAVYWALQKAACEDVLVVAAAGNLLGGQSESGPLLPAGWETQTPDCAAPAGAYRPLVYAAGGVRSDGRPLANARPGGMPRLVAFGDHATTWHAKNGATATLTGSSVSALVVAATAAAVWSADVANNPLSKVMESYQVMDRLYVTGAGYASSTAVADFILQPAKGGPLKVASGNGRKRVMLCRALGQPCPGPMGTPFLSQFVKLAQRPFTGPFPKAKKRPFKTVPGLLARPWIYGQPESDPCPPCYEDPSTQSFFGSPTAGGSLKLKISPQFDPARLTQATLVIGAQAYQLTGLKWSSGWIEIAGVPKKVSPSDDVTLEFTVVDKNGKPMYSVLSALLVQ